VTLLQAVAFEAARKRALSGRTTVKSAPGQLPDMAEDVTFESDKGIGLSVVLGLLAVVSALVMAVGGDSVVRAFGFASAMALGVVLLVVIHVYD
jgi:hypothetical protein